MKFLQIDKNLKLSKLTDMVGHRNVDNMLHLNKLTRSPNIGKIFDENCRSAIKLASDVTWETKKAILNTLTTDSDVFEYASLLGQSGWKLLNSDYQTFPSYMRLPDNINLPMSTAVLGNGEKVSKKIYSKVMRGLESDMHDIDPAIFSSPYLGDIRVPSTYSTSTNVSAMRYFRLPFGEVSLYSSLSGSSVDFPCYPEGVSDMIRAQYDQMPNMLYQYEPWVVYTNSGPRQNTYTFKIHRDMWDDHNNGKANALIRFCQAQCYPQYNGSAVHTSTVTLYIGGAAIIKGIVTDVTTDWSGPLGHDKFYLYCELAITIQEVADSALNYDVILNKPLIG